MKYYLEAIETNVILPNEPEFIRIDVTEMTQVERDAVRIAIEDIMSGKSYQVRQHNCGHEDNEACTLQIL